MLFCPIYNKNKKDLRRIDGLVHFLRLISYKSFSSISVHGDSPPYLSDVHDSPLMPPMWDDSPLMPPM